MAQSQLTVSLSPRLECALRDAVAAGEYASIEEAVNEAVALWHADRRAYQVELDHFRATLAESENDPSGDMTAEEVRAYFAARNQSDEAA